MIAGSSHGRTLRITLCEIEPGLFYATYRTQGSDIDVMTMPVYHLAACEADARRRIEEAAGALGVETLIWQGGIVTPSSPPALDDCPINMRTAQPGHGERPGAVASTA